jgi:hypothetical protein
MEIPLRLSLSPSAEQCFQVPKAANLQRHDTGTISKCPNLLTPNT